MKLSLRTLAYLIAAAVVLLVVFSSCKASKEVIKTEYIRDSTVEEQLKLYVQKLTIERDNYAKKVSELEYLGNNKWRAFYVATTCKTPVAPEIFHSEIGLGEVTIEITPKP